MDYIYYAMPVIAILLVAVIGSSAEAEAWRADRAWEKEVGMYRMRR